MLCPEPISSESSLILGLTSPPYTQTLGLELPKRTHKEKSLKMEVAYLKIIANNLTNWCPIFVTKFRILSSHADILMHV